MSAAFPEWSHGVVITYSECRSYWSKGSILDFIYNV